MSRVNVNNEIDPLRLVIVHRPDQGISRISPKRAEELLFDDIVHLPRMQQEHDVFTEVLKRFIGPENVLEIEDLLSEALNEDQEAKKEMINMIVDWEELPSSDGDLFCNMPTDLLAKVLVTGYYPEEDRIFFDPIPNFIFTRDIAVTVNDHLVITKAAKEARFRENFITRYILWAHPIFRELRLNNRVINMNKPDLFPPSKKGELVSIEGGDMMMLHKDYLLIGCSERTNAHAIRSLARKLFELEAVKNVVQVNIPADRSFMHLDTIFTQINYHDYVAYKPKEYLGFLSAVRL